MIEVGRVYKLNAPWHPRHDYHVLVFHSRIGVSDKHLDRQVFHIIHDYMNDIEQIDWDTEYVTENLVDFGMDVRDYIKNYRDNSIHYDEVIRILKKPTFVYPSNNIQDCIDMDPELELEISDALRISKKSYDFSVKVTDGPYSLRTDVSHIDGYLRIRFLNAILPLFDDDYNFIPLTPPN